MNKRLVRVKPHIFTFYKIFSKVFIIMILPFLQQIFFHPENIMQKFGYTIFNISFIITLFIFIFLEYRYIECYHISKSTFFKKGVIRHNEIILPDKEITALCFTRTFLQWIFNSYTVYIDTTTSFNLKRVEIITFKKSALRLISAITNRPFGTCIYKSRFFHPLIMSLIHSDALTGAFAVSVLIKRIGNILDNSLANSFQQQIIGFPKMIISGLTPALAYIAGFIFAGYIFGLLKQLLESINFSVLINRRFIFIFRGIIKKSIICVNRKNTLGILVKQTLLMYITKLNSLYLLYSGFKDKQTRIYIPVVNNGCIDKYTAPVIPHENRSKMIKPPKSSIIGYIGFPLAYIVVIIALCIYMYKSFETNIIARITALVLAPFGFLWLWFRILAFPHCSISYGKNTVEIRYYYHLSLMTAIVKRSSITKVVISQNPFQRISGKCHIKFYVCDKKKIKIKVKGLVIKSLYKI